MREDAATDLDAQVRDADPDRWLAGRFVADAARRADLMALYAFEAELMTIPTKVSQPMLAEIRFTWWSDQMDGVVAGDPRKGHPVLEALSAAVVRHALPRAPLDALIEAHIGRAHGRPHDLDALFVGPIQLAARVLTDADHDAAIADAARVRGLTMTGRRDEAAALRPAANRALKALPSIGFPAVAVAALRDPDAPEPVKRLALTWAVLRGRI